MYATKGEGVNTKIFRRNNLWGIDEFIFLADEMRN